METVSAHGGLVHVVFDVKSLTAKGIATLISNSPELLTFMVGVMNLVLNVYTWDAYHYEESFKNNLQKRFPGRRLFNAGNFTVEENSTLHIPGTDLFPLWPLYCADTD